MYKYFCKTLQNIFHLHKNYLLTLTWNVFSNLYVMFLKSLQYLYKKKTNLLFFCFISSMHSLLLTGPLSLKLN